MLHVAKRRTSTKQKGKGKERRLDKLPGCLSDAVVLQTTAKCSRAKIQRRVEAKTKQHFRGSRLLFIVYAQQKRAVWRRTPPACEILHGGHH